MKLRYAIRPILLFFPLAYATTLPADETEILFKAGGVAPNVLFLIDASGSMRQRDVGGNNAPTRMEVLQSSFSTVMDTAPANLNIGLMHYANHGLNANVYWWSSIKGINFPITPISAKVQPLLASHQHTDNLPDPAGDPVVRTFFKTIVNSWAANGYTPIVDALYEAARYYRGDAVLWGKDTPATAWAAHPLTYQNNLTCTSHRTETCVDSWGECGDKVAGSCQTKTYNNLCYDDPNDPNDGWKTTPEGVGYCVNNNYTGSATVTECQHKICTVYSIPPTLNYESPIQYECQANHLVLMSDGKPEYPYFPGLGQKDGTRYYPPSLRDIETNDFAPYPTLWSTFLNNLTNTINNHSPITSATTLQGYLGTAANNCADPNTAAPVGYNSGRCGPELTKWLAETDHNSTLAGKQNITTYTIGFALNADPLDRDTDGIPKGEKYLKQLAQNGRGEYFAANNEAELVAAFSNILSSIDKNGRSFGSPTYTVDENTLLAHSDEVFVPMFDANTRPRWAGNLKKFKRGADGKLYGKNNSRVTNEKGEFVDSAYDFWGDAASGKNVEQGGAANRLPAPDQRKLYTHFAGSNALGNLNIGNGNITAARLGLAASAPSSERDKLIAFTRGKNPDGTARRFMGDMLNTKPQLVTYETDTERKSYVLVATNEGYIHAIYNKTCPTSGAACDETGSGVEQWAFMPGTALKNAKTFFENKPDKKHYYGVDGGLQVWQYDANKDGKIRAGNGANDDKIYLFIALRRGGNEYYALDISDPAQPKLAWHIHDGISQFANLGQTWSKPTLAKMLLPDSSDPKKGMPTDVLVFGGGYDPRLDEPDASQRAALTNLKGADVFIVKAQTGELVWSLRQDVTGAASQLQDSIPGDIRVMDMDRNGALDRLYFADTGGNIWRVDMDIDLRDNDASTYYNYSKASLSKFAELGGSGVAKRMFFYEPDVALMQHGGKTILTLAIGSGYRAHPLDTTISDRFYVLIDRNPFSAPNPSLFPIKEDSKLVSLLKNDGTDNSTEIGADKSLLDVGSNLNGWYYEFSKAGRTGEKVLAPALTFMNKVVFTTFAPAPSSTASADPCAAPANQAHAYVLNLFNGQPVANLDRSADNSKERSFIAGNNEILAAPQIIFRPPTAKDGTACKRDDCQQTVEIRVGKLQVPLLDASNAATGAVNLGDINGAAGSVDITNILPRMFWVDYSVSKD